MIKLLDTKITSVREIASALLNYADSFSFVVRNGINVSKAAIELLEDLEPYLIKSEKVSEWPGTILIWERAILYTYSLSNETAYLLGTSENDLFKWLLPYRPEDLVFYKSSKPLFVSITHERAAYFEVDEREKAFIRSKDLI